MMNYILSSVNQFVSKKWKQNKLFAWLDFATKIVFFAETFTFRGEIIEINPFLNQIFVYFCSKGVFSLLYQKGGFLFPHL